MQVHDAPCTCMNLCILDHTCDAPRILVCHYTHCDAPPSDLEVIQVISVNNAQVLQEVQ